MITLEWYHSEGSREPHEVDLDWAPPSAYSPGYAYLHKNIQYIEKEDEMTGEKRMVWDYDEAVLSRTNYAIYAAEKAQADVEYVACMTDVDLDV